MGNRYSEDSFSEKLKAGWTKEELMKHYALSEKEYDKIIRSLENIRVENNANRF